MCDNKDCDEYLAVTQSLTPNKQEQQEKICFYQEGTFSRTVLMLFEDFIVKEDFLILLHLKTDAAIWGYF